MPLDNVHVVIVCVNYSDFLKITYPYNKHYFCKDKFIVITSPEDNETISYCQKQGIRYRIYNDFYKNASKFNKSGAIMSTQYFIHELFYNDWVLLMDADVILPFDFDKMFERKELDKNTLYSLKRMDYATKEDWQLKKNLKPYAGPPFMGYMQLYHNKHMFYHANSHSAVGCDHIFAMRFSKKEFLDKNAYVTHLGVDTVNHEGRKSIRWD